MRTLSIILISLFLAIPSFAGQGIGPGPGLGSYSYVSDNFNRSNGGLGSNWTTVPGWAAPQIISNAVGASADGTESDAYWSGTFTWTAPQFSQVQITTLPTDNSSNDCGVGTNVQSSPNKTGYYCAYNALGGTVHLRWGININGVNTYNILTSTVGSVNDTIKEVYDGYNVQCLVNGVLAYSRPDQTITGTYGNGYPYMGGADGTCRMDNFQAGNVTAYSLGSDPALVSGSKAWNTDFTGTTHTSWTVTAGAAITAGNTPVTTIAWFGQSAAPTSVTDSLGQTWVQASFNYNSANTAAIAVYYFPGTVSGTPTVTASWGSSTVSYPGMTFSEFSGVMANNPSIPVDLATASQISWTSSATNNAKNTSITTSANKELVYSGLYIFSNNATISAAGTGFTLINKNTTGSMQNAFGDEYQLQTAFGSVTGQFTGTWTSGTVSAMTTAVAFFKH
ncbi:MAG: hypothetical protein ABSA86_11435 [Oryzomonas sp.]